MIKKGASLLLAYRLEGRPVLLIGGGLVASGRLFFLLESGAHVTLVAPAPLEASIQHRVDHSNRSDITYHPREYSGRDDPIKVEDFAMVLTAIDDNASSQTVCDMCREMRVPVNVADVPPSCDFYFGAQLRRGPLQIMVSTGGMGPKIGAMMRDIIIKALPEDTEAAIEGVGALRAELRRRAPGVGGDLGRRRMEWMIGVCDRWDLGQMQGLKDEGLRRRLLDEGWDQSRVIGPEDVGVGVGSGRWFDFAGRAGLWGVGVGGLISGAAMATLFTLYLVRHSSR